MSHRLSTAISKAIGSITVITTLGLAGCGGDSGRTATSSPTPQASAPESAGALTFDGGTGTVTVRALAAPNLDTDTDTAEAVRRADELGLPRNDRLRDRQQVALPITIGGHLSRSRTGRDRNDWYGFEAEGGEAIYLAMSGTGRHPNTGDLDLALFKNTNGRRFTLIDGSFSASAEEQLIIPEAGTYALRVYAFRGKASYSLSIGTLGEGASQFDTSETLSGLLTPCEDNRSGSGETLQSCAQAIPGQWLMSMSDQFMAQAPQLQATELAERQQTMASSMGLRASQGVATSVLLTTMSSTSAEAFSGLAALNDLERQPWDEDDPVDWDPTDNDGDGMSDQEAMYLTRAVAHRSETDDDTLPEGLSAVSMNYLNYASVIPNDETALTNEQFASHYGLINLEQAWDSGIDGAQGSEDVVVAVIDTGHAPLLGPNPAPDWSDADQDPSDAEGKLRYGFDFVSIESIDGDETPGIDNDPTDVGPASATGFHGTHVAGTVAAPTGNGVGVQGVGRNVAVMPIRVLGNCGCGSSFDIIQGVLYAAGLPNVSGSLPLQRADVINLSLGGGGRSDAIQDIYNQVRDAGVIVIAAAGNSNTFEPSYPAAYDNVISVVAVSHGTEGTAQGVVRASYSNFGATVDVSAPGGQSFADANADGFPDGVLSTVDRGYAQYNGTSMAAPHVAGVAALMLSVYQDLSPEELDQALADRTIVTDVGAAGRDDEFGAGVIDALKAVQIAAELAGGAPAPDPVSPPVAVPAASPSSFDFGDAIPSILFELRNAGDSGSELLIEAINSSSPALTVQVVEVDGSGLGSYNLTLDRNAAPTGTNSAELTVQTSAGTLALPATFNVPTTAEPGNAGLIHVLLLNAENLTKTACARLLPEAGAYDAVFENVPSGDYLVVAGSDVDDNGFICDAFETCGANPSLQNIALVSQGSVSLELRYANATQLPGAVFRTCMN